MRGRKNPDSISNAMHKPTTRRLKGLIAAPHTPFGDDGAIALEVIDQQAELLINQGVAGAFVCGTTGEGASLTNAERRSVATRWVEASRGRLSVIAHVGHTSLDDARSLAQHAESIGVSAISAVAPYYFKPATVGELTGYCAEIACEAPSIPFYYYHSPRMTGVSLSPSAFLVQGGERIPNLAGIKFNDPDLFEYQRCLMVEGGCFDVPFGVDEALIGGLAAGAVGAVGSTYNYAAPLFHRLINAFEQGDMKSAQACSRKAVRIVELLIEFGGIASGKALMSLHGINCGAPRPPIRPLSEGERSRLLAAAEELEAIQAAVAI